VPQDMVRILCASSGLLLVGLSIVGYVHSRMARHTNSARPQEFGWYSHLPLFLPGMAASLAINLVVQSPVAYVATGIIWGISLPVRFILRRYVLGRVEQIEWSHLSESYLWWAGVAMACLHALLWPLTLLFFQPYLTKVGMD
jgi:hypothetical protein